MDQSMGAAGNKYRLGRIGPNAVIRLIEALDSFENRAFTARVFRACGVEKYLEEPPTEMVAEAEVMSLHQEIHRSLGDARARSIAWIAGRRTADYLLANRIPAFAQRTLKIMPAPLASRALVGAIQKNAWTFAGTGHVSARFGRAVQISISRCPICRNCNSSVPYCDFYGAVFERLFAELVHASATAVETACSAMGAQNCTFEISWS